MIILGNLSLALGVSLFILPNGIINGGTSGIAIIVEKLFNIDVLDGSENFYQV